MSGKKKDRSKSKKPVKAKAPPPSVDIEAADERRAARNVAQIREKLSTAMEDPIMRDQIVRAMRGLMYEDKT
jgi:hypothetical protein